MFASAIASGIAVVLIGNAFKPFPSVPYEAVEVGQRQGVIRVFKTEEVTPATKDPIWKVELVLNGKVVDHVNALIGRSYRQNENRHTSGNESPLPKGNYRIDEQGIVKEKFNNPELGSGYWIPITPLFSTGRSFLGIHQDPSWGRNNGESGTSGCIGLETPEDTDKVKGWVTRYGIKTLNVQS